MAAKAEELELRDPRIDTEKLVKAAERLIQENEAWLKEMAKK